MLTATTTAPSCRLTSTVGPEGVYGTLQPVAGEETRLLYPVGPNDDGTYTYVWLMDPLIEGADYDIESLLTKRHGAAQARDHLALWVDAHAAPQVVHDLSQT